MSTVACQHRGARFPFDPLKKGDATGNSSVRGRVTLWRSRVACILLFSNQDVWGVTVPGAQADFVYVAVVLTDFVHYPLIRWIWWWLIPDDASWISAAPWTFVLVGRADDSILRR